MPTNFPGKTEPGKTEPRKTEMEQRLAQIQAQRKSRTRLPTPSFGGFSLKGLQSLIGAQTKSHKGRRLLALVAAVAIPAMSFAADWNDAEQAEAGDANGDNVKPMPFEQPGNSFPGSAFYFLEDAPKLAAVSDEQTNVPLFDMTGTGELEASEQIDPSRVGPAARAFLSSGSNLSRGRAVDCLSKAVYYEAASEALGGQRAVAQVVLNRVAHPSYPNTVCGVVFQGSQRRTGCQFSFTCDGSLRRKPSLAAMGRARMVARDALSGKVYAPVGFATHYHTVWIYPYWAPSLDHIGTIGAHRFYRWKGSAGKPGAFRSRYNGAEPSTAGRGLRRLPVVNEAADPLTLAREFEKNYTPPKHNTGASNTAATPVGAKPDDGASPTVQPQAPPPVYAQGVEERGGDQIFKAENLPDSSGIKEKYRNSGRWLDKPGAPVNTN